MFIVGPVKGVIHKKYVHSSACISCDVLLCNSRCILHVEEELSSAPRPKFPMIQTCRRVVRLIREPFIFPSIRRKSILKIRKRIYINTSFPCSIYVTELRLRREVSGDIYLPDSHPCHPSLYENLNTFSLTSSKNDVVCVVGALSSGMNDFFEFGFSSSAFA